MIAGPDYTKYLAKLLALGSVMEFLWSHWQSSRSLVRSRQQVIKTSCKRKVARVKEIGIQLLRAIASLQTSAPGHARKMKGQISRRVSSILFLAGAQTSVLH